jgi:hypothetical protein
MKIVTLFRKLGVAVVVAYPVLTVAAPSATSSYTTDAQSSCVQDQTSEGIRQVNMISCFMGAMKAGALVNQGSYLALVDEKKCDAGSRDSAGNSGSNNSGSNASQYVTATVNSTRASNSDPMLVKTWVSENQDGNQTTIYVHTSASESPSSTNPYGQFRLDYCGKAQGGNSCMFNGFIDASASGLSYYEDGRENGGSRLIAMTLNASGTSAGSGRMSINESSQFGSQSTDYTFAYNTTYFRRSDGTTDQCFSRDATDVDTGLSVWRYGLYDATDGSRITRNSGFPIEYTSGGTTYHGYMGYWGLWLPQEALSTVATGSTVQKVAYNAGTASSTSYTLVKGGGKLTKYTKGTKTLAAIDQIRFTFWASANSGPAGLTGYQQGRSYEAYWDNTNKRFAITGYQSCGGNGCSMVSIAEVATSNSYWSANYSFGLSGWSQALGGEVSITAGSLANDGSNSGALTVTYRTQDLVYPSQYAGIGDLQCIADCPTVSGIAALVGGSAQTPFGTTAGNYAPTAVGNLVTYTLDATSGNLKDGTAADVTTASTALSGQFQWGVRTGKLFPTSQGATVDAGDGATDNSYRVSSVDSLTVYYIWETGPNAWNQFSAVKDSGGNYVMFDAPLQVNFTVPSGAAYSSYAGTTMVLQYNGFGDLFGIPGKCVSPVNNAPVSCDTQGARYVPEFMIPFDQTVGKVTNGSTTYLVKWLDREIRLAKKNVSVCSSAGLNLPSGISLPTSAGLKDPSNASSDVYIGTQPTVTDAPRVIHGEVKY